MTDLDVPGVVDDVQDAEAKLRDHFKATDVSVNTRRESTIQLQFHGFEGLDPALEKVGDVARRLDGLESVANVDCGVDTAGSSRPETGEWDPRPMAWVNADFEE